MITLRKIPPPKREDVFLITAWFNDPFIRRFMSTWVRKNVHTLESIEDSIQESDPTFETLFMIETDGVVIGHAGIDDINSLDQRAEMFYLIGNPSFRGKGLSFQIVFELCKYGFERLGLHCFIATVMATNKASIKPLLQNGFIPVGRIPDYNFVDGHFEDELIFSITKEQFDEKKE